MFNLGDPYKDFDYWDAHQNDDAREEERRESEYSKADEDWAEREDVPLWFEEAE